ncbi:MAG: hypothetical protein ACLUOI_31735 [Eisenbergiella sp.]
MMYRKRYGGLCLIREMGYEGFEFARRLCHSEDGAAPNRRGEKALQEYGEAIAPIFPLRGFGGSGSVLKDCGI